MSFSLLQKLTLHARKRFSARLVSGLALFLFAQWFVISCSTPQATVQPDTSGRSDRREDRLQEQVEQALRFCDEQLERSVLSVGDADRFPAATNSEGKWVTVPAINWESGFFAGCLWLLYDSTGQPQWRQRAEKWTRSLNEIQYYTKNHDLGFQMLCSYGNGYILTGDPTYRDVILQSADSLAKRYNEKIGCTRSWGEIGDQERFTVIIDNLMNLELLLWAAKNGGKKEWYDMAVSHALKTIETHVRDNDSTWHVVDFDPKTGEIIKKWSRQGVEDRSCWSRGQAWGIYGYTIMYRETRMEVFLDTARRLADYYLKRLPEDHIPYWDFDAGQRDPLQKRDSSAAAVAAAALFELSGLVHSSEEGARYRASAEKTLASLCSAPYLAVGTQSEAILLQAVRSRNDAVMPENFSYIWGDYYFLEALLRYRHLATAAK